MTSKGSKLPIVSALPKDNATLAQSEVEKGNNLFLRLGAQIDQEIPARNQV